MVAEDVLVPNSDSNLNNHIAQKLPRVQRTVVPTAIECATFVTP